MQIISCDFCGEHPSDREGYYLVLNFGAGRPSASLVHRLPPLPDARPYHFCGYDCLEQFFVHPERINNNV